MKKEMRKVSREGYFYETPECSISGLQAGCVICTSYGGSSIGDADEDDPVNLY